MDNRIYRSRETKMLAGVCGGVADMFNIDPTLVRLAFGAVTILTGMILVLLYVLCAVIIPLEPTPGYIRQQYQRRSNPRTDEAPAAQSPAEPAADAAPVHTDAEQTPSSEETIKPQESSYVKPEAISEEPDSYRNDETVIHSQADKY